MTWADLVPMNTSPVPRAVGFVTNLDDPLTEEEAETLTVHIRNGADVMWALLARAHAGKAWEALSYKSWAEYVKQEFHISKSRAYQLLDQAKVVQIVAAAAPEGTVISISPAAAKDLKKVLDEVVTEIASKTQGLPPAAAAGVVDGIVTQYRTNPSEHPTRNTNGTFGSSSGGEDDYPDFTSNEPRNAGGGEYDDTYLTPYDASHDESQTDQSDSGGGEDPPPPRGVTEKQKPDPEIIARAKKIRELTQARYELIANLDSFSSLLSAAELAEEFPLDQSERIAETLPQTVQWVTEFSTIFTNRVNGQEETLETEDADNS
jgi:hypothetical protein